MTSPNKKLSPKKSINSLVKLIEEPFDDISQKACNLGEISGYKADKKICDDMSNLFSSNIQEAIKYSAKLNIPLYPRNGKQIVLGTTKYLLPYFICEDAFITFTVKDDQWSIKLNMLFLECMMIGYFNTNIIRLVTTPTDLVDKNKNLRVTGKELCLLKHKFGLKFYQLLSPEYDNVFFICMRKPNSKCEELGEKDVIYL